MGAPRPSGFRPAKAPKGTRKSTKEEAEHGSAAALSLVSPETPPGGEAGGKPGGQRFSPAAPGRGSPVSRPPPPAGRATRGALRAPVAAATPQGRPGESGGGGERGGGTRPETLRGGRGERRPAGAALEEGGGARGAQAALRPSAP